jgi:hypothetical protein
MGRPIDFSCQLGEEEEGTEANTLAQKSDVAIPFCRPPKLKLQTRWGIESNEQKWELGT